MDTSIIGLIVIAAVSIALLAIVLAWMMLTKRRSVRDAEPATSRESRKRERVHVKEQDALGDPTFAQGYRTAQAEPDAAHIADLLDQDGGAPHRGADGLSGPPRRVT